MIPRRALPGCALAVAVFLVSTVSSAQTDFIDVAAKVGIDVSPTLLPVWDFGSGVAFVDFDNDGDLDIYVVMGHGEPNRLYRYDPATNTYDDVAVALGCADAGNGKSVKFADYDNDGDRDLFVTNLDGFNRLYRNEGGLEFTDVTVEAGLDFYAKSHGAAWGDYDNDGYLDLWVAVRNRDVADVIYRNRGNGTFANVSAVGGITGLTAGSWECVWIDYDHDGDQDVYVVVDGTQEQNRLWRNEGNYKFTEVAVSAGAAGWIDGMGIAVGDYDNDGWEDIYVTHTGFVSRGNILLHNNGDATFTDVAVAQGVAVGQYGWGDAFFDYDNDGDLDLYVVNFAEDPGLPGAKNQMYRNDLADKFVRITDQAGVGDTGVSFGLATGDYNNDGYIDLFVNNRDAPGVLYENQLSGNNWLNVRPLGRMGRTPKGATASNRDGIGARITVTTAKGDQLRVVRGGSSYLSEDELVAHFGLADATKVDRLEIEWPSGLVDVRNDIDANQSIVVCEGGWPVEFTYTDASPLEGASVELQWRLLCDGNLSGFRIYRSRKVDGTFDPEEEVQFLGAMTRQWTDNGVEPEHTYRYSVAVVGPDDSQIRSDSLTVTTTAPHFATDLRQNYPNPFNPQTKIEFELAESGPVRLAVYDVSGALVRVLVNEVLDAGEHEYLWEPGVTSPTVASGPYFYRLNTRDAELTRKMVLLK